MYKKQPQHKQFVPLNLKWQPRPVGQYFFMKAKPFNGHFFPKKSYSQSASFNLLLHSHNSHPYFSFSDTRVSSAAPLQGCCCCYFYPALHSSTLHHKDLTHTLCLHIFLSFFSRLQLFTLVSLLVFLTLLINSQPAAMWVRRTERN